MESDKGNCYGTTGGNGIMLRECIQKMKVTKRSYTSHTQVIYRSYTGHWEVMKKSDEGQRWVMSRAEGPSIGPSC